MGWTVRYYLSQANVWSTHRVSAQSHGNMGAAAYAARKVNMWRNIAEHADARFLRITPAYITLI
jgi:hypothetical protein